MTDPYIKTIKSGVSVFGPKDTHAIGASEGRNVGIGSVSVREVISSAGKAESTLMGLNFRLTGRHSPFPGNTTGTKQR